MRKFITAVLAVLLLAGLCTTAAAAPEKLTVSAASVQTGQTVFVSVTLNEAVTADSLALTYSYDRATLTAIPESSQWSVKGVLDDFNNKNEGAWADKAAKSLNGEICLLAFRAKEDAKLADTKVSVTLSFMKNGNSVGKFDAKGTVSVTCGHFFDGWTYVDAHSHTRQCVNCKEVERGTHSWDAGVVKPHPQKPASSLKVFTCTGCGGTKELELSGVITKPEPTEATQEHTHEVTRPTQPLPTETRPEIKEPTVKDDAIPTTPEKTPDHTHSHEETTSYIDYNAPDHTHPEQTVPQIIPVETGEAEDLHAGHDHSTEQNNPKWVTALAVFGTIGVIGAGAVLAVKKKNW